MKAFNVAAALVLLVLVMLYLLQTCAQPRVWI